jgi:CheY-like chemotaxis protein
MSNLSVQAIRDFLTTIVMEGESILIVDDNPTNLKLASFLLKSEGYVVSTAVDGHESLKMMESLRPQLILMDVQLPGIDGLEVTRRLKSNPATRSIPVVALTAYAMKGDEQKVLDAGCDGYIAKPIDTRTFPSKIRSLLAGNASRSSKIAGGEFDPQSRAARYRGFVAKANS